MIFFFTRDEQDQPVCNVIPLLAAPPGGSGYVAPFNWGEEGAGTDRLAANLLAACGLPAGSAWRLALRFSREVLLGLPRAGGSLHKAAILAWLDANPDSQADARFSSPSQCSHGHSPIVADDHPERK